MLLPGQPYLEAEVIYAARHEWAVTADDILARRTRLAFLDKEASIAAIPKVDMIY
jgi:glycerol-3-phosphate dehydrogenase